MIQTPNYQFDKPELSDPANITATNANWDKLDSRLTTVKVDTTLTTNGWTNNNRYNWYDSRITDPKQIIELLPSPTITKEQLEALQVANIVGTSQTVGRITLIALGEVPTISIPVVFLIRGDIYVD